MLMKLSSELLADLKTAFSLFEADVNGCITEDGLKKLLYWVKMFPTDDQFSRITNSLPIYGICSEAFGTYVEGAKTSEELRNVMFGLGQSVTDAELHELINEDDGKLTVEYSKFLTLMVRKLNNADAKAASDEEWIEYKVAYKYFSKNTDGTMSSEKIAEIARGLGRRPSIGVFDELIAEVDSDGDGNISYNEFLILIRRMRISAVDFEQTFLAFDHDGDGFISPADLRHVMTNLGEQLTDAELDEMIGQADRDGNGKINYEESPSNKK